MKKLIGLICITAVLLCTSVHVSAKNNRESSNDPCSHSIDEFGSTEKYNVVVDDEDGFTVHKIKFLNIKQIVENTSYKGGSESVEQRISDQGHENIQVLKQYIKDLDICDQEKSIHLKSIDKLEIELTLSEGYLDEYTIYLAPTTRTENEYTYYGRYSGMYFYQRPIDGSSVNYKKMTERNRGILNNWIAMIKSFVLNIETFSPVTMAITALDMGWRMYSDNYTARNGDYTEYYVRVIRRNRAIGIINAWNEFQTVLVDCKVDMYPYSIYYYADPEIYGKHTSEASNMTDRRTLYSQYYNDREYNLRTAYEQYTQRPGIILYLWSVNVNSSMFAWEFK